MQATISNDIIEGTWEEISRQSHKFNGHRLRVVILPDEPSSSPRKFMTKGIFPQLAAINEEDFKSAEFQGDIESKFDGDV